MHVHQNGVHLGKVLSCFVTERKHRAIKSAGTWTFRNYEHTLLRQVLHDQTEAMADGTIFAEQCLLRHSKQAVDRAEVFSASSASLLCGQVHRNDVVVLRGGAVVDVRGFWALRLPSADVFAKVSRLSSTPTPTVWVRDGSVGDELVPVCDIVRPVVYAEHAGGRVRILHPAGCM